MLSILVWAGSATITHAQISELGTAADFGVLAMGSGSSALNFTNGIITGDVGLAAGSTTIMAPDTITGQLDLGATARATGQTGNVEGGIVNASAQMATAVSDAATAASYFQGLAATQNYSSLSGTNTISGNGGLNVIDLTGNLSLTGGATLTLSGNASDIFVFNIDGTVTTQANTSIDLVGISASQVIFNLIGSGNKASLSMSSLNGVFLAENGAISVSGGTENGEFIAGGNLTISSGAQITQLQLPLAPVPELSPALMGGCALALMAGLVVISRVRRQGSDARTA